MFGIIITFFIFGLIVGSFLNVFIYRYHTGRTLRGRSICLTCGKQLSFFELIPVVSFLIQGGRCRACRSRISVQYPLVEIITGLVFAAIAWKFLQVTNYEFVRTYELSLYVIRYTLYTLIFSLLIVISVYDIRHKIIPNGPVYFFITLALLVSVLNAQLLTFNFQLSTFWGHIIAGLVLALPLAALWFFSSGRLMGFGDAKLALGMGFLLGLSGGIAALILSFWIGAVVSLILILFSRLSAGALPARRSIGAGGAKAGLSRKVAGLTLKSEVPFGPFLILSTFIVFLFDLDLFTLVKIFQF